MTNSTTEQNKNRLLADCVQFVRGSGLKDLSLRSLAMGVNMSARMLLHYFGSSEALFGSIMREFVQREKTRIDELVETARAEAEPVRWFMTSYISALTAKGHTAIVNSIFEMYGAAIVGNAEARKSLQDLLIHWVAGIKNLVPERDEVDAVLVIALVNGLILDVLVTADQSRVNKAVDRIVQLLSGK